MVFGSVGVILSEVMKIYQQYLFLVTTLAFMVGACEKVDVPEPEDERPVFFSKLQVGGDPIDLVAGEGDYFMDATFVQDSGTIDFVGILRPKDCITRLCPGSLRIGIRHVDRFDHSGIDVGASLQPKTVDFAYKFRSDSALVRFTIANPSTDAAQKLSWSLDQLTGSTKPLLTTKMIRDRDYRVGLQINQRGCTSRQVQTIRLPEGGCRSKIKINSNNLLSVRSNGTPPLTYNWMNQSKDSVFQLRPATANMRENIWVRVTDARGCVSESEIGFNSLSKDQYCIADFTYETERIVNRDHFQLGKVTIDYVSEDGVVFTSNYLQQPTTSIFEISSVEDFKANNLGQPTKKIKLNFSALLFAARNDQTLEMQGETVFAVAYPEP